MWYRILTRKLWKINISLAMTLPKDFCDYHELDRMRKVTLLQFEDFILILPVQDTRKIVEIAKSKQVEELAKLVKDLLKV